MSHVRAARPALVAVDSIEETPPATALGIHTGQQFWTPYQLAALVQLGIEKAPEPDLAIFLNQCQRSGLDPFARQIYMIPRRDQGTTRWTIQTSIDGFRVIAERSGKYEGQTPQQWCGPDGKWRDVWAERNVPVASRIGVYRTGWREPVYAVAHWREYAVYRGQGDSRTLTSFWSRMSNHMISKVAEALALRKAFPRDLSGLYTTDEMDQANYAGIASIAESVPVQRRQRARATAAETTLYDWDALIAEAEDAPATEAAEKLRDLYSLAVYANRIGHCPDEVVDRITLAGEVAVHDERRERERSRQREQEPPDCQPSLFEVG